MTRRLSSQVVVIVGASSGIGLRTAQEAARRGAQVVLAARNGRSLEDAAEEIRRAGGEAVAVPTDVTDEEQVRNLVERAIEAYGRIDTWITSAAVSLYAPFSEVAPEDFRRVMEVNFMGQVNCARAALPHLEATEGTLICVGSALSDRGVPLQGAYCASKHALKGWLDSLRVELLRAGSKVCITLVKPSSINTPLFNKAKTQMGVMPQPIPPIYDPDLASEAILEAAIRCKRDVFVGGSGKLLSTAERLSPALVDVHQLLTGFDAQKTDWPKSADAPNNLFAPVAEDGGVRGDFLEGSKRHSVYQTMAANRALSLLAVAAVAGLGSYLLARPGSPEE